ncbi:3-deoxy-7-phosphoheptulonate synthase [Effusibacillus lacus]|uniref:3-deoxy-7-phosphoheptulonate synthase n=1 Tax=Effusibacillus lacus TaxID=1348429 RepID=A0A292YU08_9BACL|nr:3-deoxy-7-phosphoheptulonate synthase [Effusibacillus lacus]TCS73572.1 3-deoxy-D-arabinoheptulosonate-7-phosphate synthase [Effusibacillus lacus]GAX91934.1 3-deoxy-7-phosphoheptulonate synthase [Effusibacillus lacus]
MVIVMSKEATEQDLEALKSAIEELGMQVHVSRGEERTIVGLIGNKRNVEGFPFTSYSGVESVVHVTHPFKLASRDFHPEPTIVDVDGVQIGGGNVVIMAGPCSVESREQLMESACAVREAGAQILRGGAFKPRTSPYAFNGLGEEGLKLLAEAREKTGLKIVTELMDLENLELVAHYTDIIQIGARNMQNFPLLRELGKIRKPVMLKRGLSATIEEWLMAAEYVLSGGNKDVILCERGIRTFETATRNTLDLNAVPVVRRLSHLPVIVDPSHGTGVAAYVPSMSKAGIAVGSDGLMIEMHPNPAKALSDGAQSLTIPQFHSLMKEIKALTQALGMRMEGLPLSV